MADPVNGEKRTGWKCDRNRIEKRKIGSIKIRFSLFVCKE
jgi:hypothetical protein